MPLWPRPALALGALLAVLLSPSRASAQVGWDAGLELGGIARLRSGQDASGPVLAPGVVGELHAHVALVPMVRVGAYLAEDASFTSGLPLRETTEAGLRSKLRLPFFLPGRWRSFVFLGVGIARAYLPGYEPAGGMTPVPGAAGEMLDLPLGVGVSRMLWRPWELFAELESRVGMAYFGSLYDGSRGGPSGGRDSFAVGLSVGVSLEE